MLVQRDWGAFEIGQPLLEADMGGVEVPASASPLRRGTMALSVQVPRLLIHMLQLPL